MDRFDADATRDWFVSTRPHALAGVTLYVLLAVFAPRLIGKPLVGERLMKPATVVWNTLMAAFSGTALYHLAPEFVERLGAAHRLGDYRRAWCHAGDYFTDPGTGRWAYLFHLSKWVELGDTLLLIVRAKPVLFLHWYHHMLVLADSWFSYKDAGGVVAWGIIMNLAVHCVMYSYFAVATLKRDLLPRCVPFCVTCMQIGQFVVGTVVLTDCTYVLFISQSAPCDVRADTLLVHLFMYMSFLALFVQYFCVKHFKDKAKAKTKVVATPAPIDHKGDGQALNDGINAGAAHHWTAAKKRGAKHSAECAT